VAVTLQEEGSWRVHDEQDLGEFGRGRLRRVSVDLPDGVTFDQYVIVLPEASVVAAVNTAGAVLMVRRHRFIVNRWCGNCRAATSMRVGARRRCCS
jgi:hypothetical protein